MDHRDTAHQSITQMPVLTVSTDESSSSASLLLGEAQSSSATMLCWNKETVRKIISHFPQTVKVRVSHPFLTDGYTFDINKALLIRFSPYYRAVFLGGFSDKDQEIFVMGISPEDMHAFKRWVYDGELELDLESHDDAYRQLIRLYVFADYYDFPTLRRAIMSLLVRNNKEHHSYRVPHLPLLEDCLSQLPQTSPLYRWLFKTWVEHIGDVEVYGAGTQYLWNEMPMEFRLLFFDSYHHTGILSEPCSCCHNACDYHEHESEEEWRRTCHTLGKNLHKPPPRTYF
ncbi:hypothetical protein KCU64_g2140, partial [Aureobasidium melanogenum]